MYELSLGKGGKVLPEALTRPAATGQTLFLEYGELISFEDIKEYLTIRAHVYKDAGYLDATAPDLDIDPYDRNCRYVGAFVEGEDGPIMVGGARLILPPGEEPNLAVLEQLARPLGGLPASATYHYCTQSGFDLSALLDYADRHQLRLAEFGRTVCLPEYRSRYVGLGLVQAVHGLAYSYGIDLGLSSAPPKLEGFYAQFGWFAVCRQGAQRVAGLDTDAVVMLTDFRAPKSHSLLAYRASVLLDGGQALRLCSCRDCLNNHDHGRRRPLIEGALEFETGPGWTPVGDFVEQVAASEVTTRVTDESLRLGMESPTISLPDDKLAASFVGQLERLGFDHICLGQLGGPHPSQALLGRLLTRLPIDLKSRLSLAVPCQAGEIERGFGLLAGRSARLDVVVQAECLHEFEPVLPRLVGRPFAVVLEGVGGLAQERLLAWLDSYAQTGVECVFLVDSTGTLEPDQVRQLLRLGRRLFPKLRLGWGGGNDRGLALANALAALEEGAIELRGSGLGLAQRAGTLAADEVMVRSGWSRELWQTYRLAVGRLYGVPTLWPGCLEEVCHE